MVSFNTIRHMKETVDDDTELRTQQIPDYENGIQTCWRMRMGQNTQTFKQNSCQSRFCN
jgi:hypothetical protein